MYGVLQDFEVQENDLRMKQPITAETLFEEFVEHIEIEPSQKALW